MTFTNLFVDGFCSLYYYNVALTLFSWKKVKLPESYSTKTNEKSFTILIPCHNEESVIEGNLKSIYESNYNKKLLNVVVIADNCSDSTVDVCNRFLNEHPDFNCTILEVNGGSKPKAINKAVSLLKEQQMWTDDCIFVLDSDNRVSQNIFKTYNYYHSKGEKILQCRIVSQNDDSYVSKGFTSSFNTMAYGFQVAKNRIGLSGTLSGTGFSVDRIIFDDIGFEKCDTLTEDLEFSVLAILKNYKVKFVQEEYVLNQNLDNLKASIIQRSRWCKGHMQVSMKLSLDIIKQFIKKPSLQLFDSFIFVNSPSRAFIYTLGGLISLFAFRDVGTIVLLLSLIALIYNFIFVMKCNSYKIKYFIPHAIYSFFMYFIILHSIFTYKNNTWVKTEHKQIS